MELYAGLQTQVLAPFGAAALLSILFLTAVLSVLLHALAEQWRSVDDTERYTRRGMERAARERSQRLEHMAHLLVDLLADQEDGSFEAVRSRLELISTGPMQSRFLDGPADVAEGLVAFARVYPEIALHDHNVLLLGKLRGLGGPVDFVQTCQQVAAQLESPAHGALAEGLRRGNLPWQEFVRLVRRTEITATASLAHMFPGRSRTRPLAEDEPIGRFLTVL